MKIPNAWNNFVPRERKDTDIDKQIDKERLCVCNVYVRELLIFAHENKIDKTITGYIQYAVSISAELRELFYYRFACKLDGKPKF